MVTTSSNVPEASQGYDAGKRTKGRTAFALFIEEGRHFRQRPVVAAMGCFPNMEGRDDSA